MYQQHNIKLLFERNLHQAEYVAHHSCFYARMSDEQHVAPSPQPVQHYQNPCFGLLVMCILLMPSSSIAYLPAHLASVRLAVLQPSTVQV